MAGLREVLRPNRLILIAILGMLLVGGGFYFGVNFAVERAVTVDAEHKARQWSDYFLTSMPRLDKLLAEGQLDAEQQAALRTAEQLGDVFRFKLFDEQGRIVLVSDEENYALELPAEREHSGSAAGVIATGVSLISVNSGIGKQNRPPLYVEAYVPMRAPDGTIRGVVEVYLDQTATASLLRTTFTSLALGLALVAALAFGVPTLAFVFRSRQAEVAKKKAEFLAHHDPMTGLLNRSTFTSRLEAMLQAPPDRLTVVFLDVDDFKSINDTYGHEAGDEFLKHVARCIGSLCGKDELVARPGGDEFTVALVGRDNAEVMAYVEAVVQAVSQPISIRGRAVVGRISAGIYEVEPGASLADAMHKADLALYQAKIDGRNTYRLFSAEIERRMLERRALEQLVREATAEKRFEIHFQPLLAVETRKCVGFEALLRLRNREGNLVPPVTFIPVAEAMGLINEIGNWVLQEATRVAVHWPEPLFVSVNLSVRQFEDGKLFDSVRAALTASGLPANRLELEVTESMLMENTESVGRQLGQLHELGVSIAMDDFGTGYSSLGYLWQFGFDKLKIDQSFVAALDEGDSKAREILDTIIMLGHKLDMTVTAEGIETDYHARVLASLACDQFQGFLYGRPAPATELAAYLLDNLGPAVAGAEPKAQVSA